MPMSSLRSNDTLAAFFLFASAFSPQEDGYVSIVVASFIPPLQRSRAEK